jgi:CheY-like chemotaxis protein
MIFDDDEEFGEILVGTLEDHNYYAELIPSVTKLDTATTWNNFWDCIVCDVDFEGQDEPGHSIISNRVKSHHLNCPIIVISGQLDVDLQGIKKLDGDTFAAYLSKRVPHADEPIITAIEQAIYNTTKLALARFKFLFKELGKLNYVIAPDELSDEMLGISPREGNTTIEMLIDDCLGENIDKIEIDMYIRILWQKYEDFRRGLH